MYKLCILLYYLICLGYTFFVLKKKRENGLFKAIIITFFPVFGFVLIYYLFKPSRSIQPYPVPEVETRFEQIEKLDRLNLLQPIIIEEEINIVPIKDALILNENKIKRKLLIRSLKENSIQNTKILEKALQNKDSETSHYAASAIMEMKRRLQNSIQELSFQLDEHPENVEIMSSYADIINKYIESGFLDEGAFRYYQSLFSSILERIVETGHAEKRHYIDKINIDLNLQQYEKAGYYSDKFLENHPHEEMAYIMAIKIQYILHNSKQLQQIISNLKKQPVRLSAYGLSIIRFWLLEDKNGVRI
jgi:tetratricopeptide (TPR) repeat protein